MAPVSLAFAACPCQGARHLVCRRWTVSTVKDTLAQFSAPISAPPARPKLYDCGCSGTAHPVCDPTYARVRERPALLPAKRLTLRQALRDGLTLTPHLTHTFRDYPIHGRICDCGATIQEHSMGYSAVHETAA